MRVDALFLAEAAAALNGKLYVHGGGVTDIEAPMLPWTHPQLAIVIRLAVSREEPGEQRTLGISATDPNGGELFPRFEFALGPLEEKHAPHDERFVDFTLTLSPITFHQAGVYRLLVETGDRILRTMQFAVVLAHETYSLDSS